MDGRRRSICSDDSLALSLRHCELWLAASGLEAEGAGALGMAFAARHPVLRSLRLDVSECRLPHPAVRTLASGIRSSCTLVECHLTVGMLAFDPLGSGAADALRTMGALRALEMDERMRCTVRTKH